MMAELIVLAVGAALICTALTISVMAAVAIASGTVYTFALASEYGLLGVLVYLALWVAVLPLMLLANAIVGSVIMWNCEYQYAGSKVQ